MNEVPGPAKPEPKLTKAEEAEVKRVARELLEKLEGLLDAVDWTAGQQTRGAGRESGGKVGEDDHRHGSRLRSVPGLVKGGRDA